MWVLLRGLSAGGFVGICTITPIAQALVGAVRELGARVGGAARAAPAGTGAALPGVELRNATVPPGPDLLFARDKHKIEPLRTYEPDLVLCWDLKIPTSRPRRAPSRGGQPSPCAPAAPAPRSRSPGRSRRRWSGAARGTIWMPSSTPATCPQDERADRGRRCRDLRVRAGCSSLRCASAALPRPDRGRDEGDLLPTEGVSWAGHLEDDEYTRVDEGAGARDPRPGACVAPDVWAYRATRTGRRADGRRSCSSRPSSPTPAATRAGRVRRRP